MIDKKYFILVSILFLIPIVYAQSGCCINPASEPLSCKTVTSESICSTGATTKAVTSSDFKNSGYYLFFPNQNCNEGSVAELCQQVCNVCADPNSPLDQTFFWDYEVYKCYSGSSLWERQGPPDDTKTADTCTGDLTTPVTPAPKVSGNVKDGTVNAVGAIVSCTSSSAIADNDGNYQLDACKTGTEIITATLGTKSGTVTVSGLVAGGTKTGANIILTTATTAALTVNVKNSAGAALSAAVTVAGLNGYSSSNTGSSVQFSSVPVGQIQIKVEKAGHATNIQSPTLTSAGSIINVVLTATATKTLSGDVNSSAAPRAGISGVAVELFHYANNVKITDGQTTTNSNGHYSMTVPTGTNYVLEGKAGTYDTNAISSISVTDNKVQHIFLTPTAGVVTNVEYTFNVKEQITNDEIPNAYVQLLNDDQQLNAYVYSNSDGIARTTLAKGTYTIRVNKDNAYQQYLGRITISDTGSFDVIMVPLAKLTISGTVVDSTNNNPIMGQIISFLGQTYPANSNGYFNFEITVPSNDATLYVRAANYQTESRVIAKDQTIGNQGTIELTPTECNDQQNLGSLTLFDPAFADKQIRLEWEAKPCSPKTFILERKTEGNEYAAIKEINPDTFSYSDSTGIEGDETYYYRIKAIYEIGINLVTQISNEVQITLGPKMCFDGDIAFCTNNVQNKCSNGALIQTACPAEKICIEKSDTVTECVEPKQCSLCNRPFGVFSQSISGVSLFGGKGSSLSLFDFKSTLSDIFFCADQAIPCYEDYSRTVADKYYGCSETITSCYDYVSESACTDNKCLRSQVCEWKDSSYSELGVGVCRPENEKAQDCKKFNIAKERINQAANKVFITKEMCSLYGNSCYYSSAKDLCLNGNEVSCYDYADKTDCLGSTDGENAVVDVSWGLKSGTNYYIKKSGTNAITTESLDSFNLKTCKFTDKCIKDADNNNEVAQQIYYGNSIGVKQDCLPDLDGKYSLDCARDVSVPETIVVHKDYVNKLEFDYDVVDYDGINQLRPEGIKTYASGNSVSLPPLYPDVERAADKIIFDVPGGIVGILGQNYRLSYFSEDASHNLEVVKSFTVTLDTVKPEITDIITIIPNLETHSVTVNARLTLSELRNEEGFSGQPNDDLISCVKREGSTLKTGLILVIDATGANVESPLNEDTYLEDSTADGILRNEVSETYSDIETGTEPNSGITLRYVWECYDGAGNIASDSYSFPADADMMISNPTPSSEAVASGVDVPISIKTQKDGTCSYSSNNGVSWTEFTGKVQEPDGWVHSAVANVPINEEHTDYTVKCDFADIQGTIFGSNADTIRVTVDDKAPNTLPFVNDEQIIFDSSHWIGQTGFELRCVDVKQGQGPRIFTPVESGCANVYYCDELLDGADCDPVQKPGDSFTPTIEASTVIRYYSVDNLGKPEQVKEQPIKVDLIPPVISLSSPVDTSGSNALRVDTKEPTIPLIGKIINDHAGDVSPMKFFGSYYKVTDCMNHQILNGTIDINDADLVSKSIDFSRIIPLDKDQRYCISVFAKDSAENSGQLGPVEVVKDSIGPNLSKSNLYRRSPITSGITTNLDVPFGQNFILQIRELEDSYAGYADLAERVDSVWIEDMFGTMFKVNKLGQIWEGTVQTKYWPVGLSYITLFANDSVNNIASKRINFTIADTVDPTSDITLENIYGIKTQKLTKGNNYIILNASESLRNVTFYFSINNKHHNVTFMARDIDAITWIGNVNIPSGLTGNAVLGGLMTDLNGRTSSVFSSNPISVDSYDFSVPTPNQYVSSLPTIQFAGIADVENNPRGYTYQFLLNGKPVAAVNGVISGLKNGANDIQIRVEDKYRNYEVRTYRITAAIEETAGTPDIIPPVISPTDIQIVSPNIKVISNKITSRSGTVDIRAPASVKDDVSNSYIIGQDAKIYYSDSDNNFDLPLIGRTFSETVNVLRIIFEDTAGNQAVQSTEIIKDLQPPNLIRLEFGKIIG